MKPLVTLCLVLTMLLGGCVRDKDLVPLGNTGAPVNPSNPTQVFDKTGQQLRTSGTFRNGIHAVSGTVQLYERDGKQTLVFENFRSDTGPDLRIYLAADTQATRFSEVSLLTTTGNFYVEVPTGIPLNQQRYVLIWCKRFAVHFGNAELK